MSAVNLLWLLYTLSSGWLFASGPPKAPVASDLWVHSLSISVHSGSSALRLMPLRGFLCLHGR